MLEIVPGACWDLFLIILQPLFFGGRTLNFCPPNQTYIPPFFALPHLAPHLLKPHMSSAKVWVILGDSCWVVRLPDVQNHIRREGVCNLQTHAIPGAHRSGHRDKA